MDTDRPPIGMSTVSVPVRVATQKFAKLECRTKTVSSTVVCRYVSRALPFVYHAAKQRSAVRKCVFFSVHFGDFVLVLFCDRTDLLK
jgi:hypothetical protein